MTDLNVALRLTTRDQMSRPASQALQGVRTESQRLFQARETLGVRSEQRLQREIRQTELAYRRLTSAGTLSAREQARAYDAMRAKVAELRRELGQVSALQRGLGMLGAGQRGLATAAGIGGGIAAGAYIVSRPASAQMSYDRRLAMMANTAYSDRSTEGRMAGMRTLSDAVLAAVRFGGGSKDQAAQTLDELIASGAFSVKQSIDMLPTLQRFGTGTGADPRELSQIAVRAMQNFGIKPENLGKALDMALVAGQQGGFEIRDMAKWLPEQMAMARNSGLSGMDGFAKLLAANQASLITAGTKDAAGNNLVNLLGKINSPDTARDASKLGIDLSGNLARARQLGVDSLDAFVNIVDEVANRDKRYRSLRDQAGAQQGDARAATLQSMTDILMGTALGKLVQDRQAMLALVGLMNNRSYVKEVQKAALAGEGANERNFALIAQTPSFKVEQVKNEAEFAQNSAFSGFNQAVGNAAEKLTAYAREYPGLTSAVAGATTALSGLAAVAAGVGIGGLLRGGAGAAGGAVAGGAVRGAVGAAGRLALRAVPVVGWGMAAYGVGSWLSERLSNKDRGGASVGTWETAAAAGQGPGGTTTPLLNRLDKQTAAIEALSKAPTPITVPVKVVLDSTVIAEYTNTVNAREARRN